MRLKAFYIAANSLMSTPKSNKVELLVPAGNFSVAEIKQAVAYAHDVMKINFNAAKWLNKPKLSEITERTVKITTEPNTDFWQRSYYGF